MPRPTVAQLAYGSCTVIFSTLAMLLLSGTSSVTGIAVIAVSAIALGLLVALTVAPSRPRTVPAPEPAARAESRAEQQAGQPVPVAASGRSASA
ncbi:hypothetical protein ACH4ZX_24805 [Streptomyces sp. NPDC020490]|uniref:hypothetical protein n=1 Tax=Streptomyces sp. NPDC020490 TaxID=3365078 RepID=UPI0037B30AC4